MNHNWVLYIVVFTCAFAVSLLLTPYVKILAIKVKAIDYPKKRGMHLVPIPRMGGVAIVCGFLFSILIALPFVQELHTIQFLSFIIGATLITAVGILDDIKNLSARTKLFFQIIAALIIIFSGIKIDIVSWPIPTSFTYLSGPLTLIWIIGVTNAVNIIDGLDGLAAGVSSICAFCLLVLCIISGSPLAVVLTSALAGSCLGFLPRNFNPAEIYMGDSGSTFLGFVLAVSSIIGVFKFYALLSVIIATFALALPIFDTLFAMIRRFLSGKPIMEADRGHIHHRLIDLGCSHKQAVFIIYCFSFLCAMIAIFIAINDIVALTVILVFVAVLYLMLTIYRKRTIDKS